MTPPLKCKLGLHDWEKFTYPIRIYEQWCQYVKVCRRCKKENRQWVLEH